MDSALKFGQSRNSCFCQVFGWSSFIEQMWARSLFFISLIIMTCWYWNWLLTTAIKDLIIQFYIYFNKESNLLYPAFKSKGGFIPKGLIVDELSLPVENISCSYWNLIRINTWRRLSARWSGLVLSSLAEARFGLWFDHLGAILPLHVRCTVLTMLL